MSIFSAEVALVGGRRVPDFAVRVQDGVIVEAGPRASLAPGPDEPVVAL